MDQLYFDGMTISSVVGFQDLFITFTCNPNWPEIQRLLDFKLKFDQPLKDLTKNHILGKVIACKCSKLLFSPNYLYYYISIP
jgi:hypothetical protein